MAKKATKSRISKKKSGFRFRWWMGVGIVVVIAVVGVVVVRFSQASSGNTTTGYLGDVDKEKVNVQGYLDKFDRCITTSGTSVYCARLGEKYSNGYTKWHRVNRMEGGVLKEAKERCATIWFENSKKVKGNVSTFYTREATITAVLRLYDPLQVMWTDTENDTRTCEG